MVEEFYEVEMETRMIGPMILTTPILERLGLRQIINRLCPIGGQADIDHGTVAELIVQCRLTDPRPLYDHVDWAEKYDIPVLYQEVENAQQLNDDRIGRTLDVLYQHRAQLWGELIANAAHFYEIDLTRLHADTMPIKFEGQFPNQDDSDVPTLEEGYNPQGEWIKQLKLFGMAAGDSGLPVWFNILDGGQADSPVYAPEFDAFYKAARMKDILPLHEIILIGDRKMATFDNQLTWLRQGIGFIGPISMQEKDKEALQALLDSGQTWQDSQYVALRDEKKAKEKQTTYSLLSRDVEVCDSDCDKEKSKRKRKTKKKSKGKSKQKNNNKHKNKDKNKNKDIKKDKEVRPTKESYQTRHIYVHSSALAAHEAKRRQNEIEAIEKEIQRIQGIVNKYDYKTKEITIQRVQKKAFKNRRAQKYFKIEVYEDQDKPEAPLELRYKIDEEAIAKDAELDGIYTLVAGGKALELEDVQIFKEWKGQHKIEHTFSMVNDVILNLAVFLKKPARIVSFLLLVIVGALVAGLIERQIRRVVEELQQPIKGLMPEGRDTLRPTISRIFKAFAHYSLIQFIGADGTILKRQFTKFNDVQKQIIDLLGIGKPQDIFNNRKLI